MCLVYRAPLCHPTLRPRSREQSAVRVQGQLFAHARHKPNTCDPEDQKNRQEVQFLDDKINEKIK